MPLIVYPLAVIFCTVATLCAVATFCAAAARSLIADDPGARPHSPFEWFALLGAALFFGVCPAACAVMLLLATFG